MQVRLRKVECGTCGDKWLWAFTMVGVINVGCQHSEGLMASVQMG